MRTFNPNFSFKIKNVQNLTIIILSKYFLKSILCFSKKLRIKILDELIGISLIIKVKHAGCENLIPYNILF